MKKRMFVIGTVLLLVIGFGLVNAPSEKEAFPAHGASAVTRFSGGDGSAGNPYQISNVNELQWMGNTSNLNKHFILINDINASATKTWNSGAGFVPVGTTSNKFTGSLNGKGYNITDLFIKRPTTDYVGLFGFIYSNAHVSNISLINNNVTGRLYVGGLVAYNNPGYVFNCRVNGTTTGSRYVGGLVGHSWGFIFNCSSSGKTYGDQFVGGLLGRNWIDPVYNCSATGRTIGNISVGGLVGENHQGSVLNSSSACDMNENYTWYVGGLVGTNYYGSVYNCSHVGNVTGHAGLGGIIGNSDHGSASNCSAIGNISGDSAIGGLVGSSNLGSISNCSAYGNAAGFEQIGGLVGYTSGSVSYCYATVNTTGNISVGGLIGLGSAYNSHYNIDTVLINGKHQVTTGGVFDWQYTDWFDHDKVLKISNYRTNLTPYGGYYNITNISGLRDILGFTDEPGYRFQLGSDIDMSSASGLYIPYFSAKNFNGNGHAIMNVEINQTFSQYLGMFGHLQKGSIIENLTLVNISAVGNENVGGLLGENIQGYVINCTVIGNISGNTYVGGLIGNSHTPSITNCSVVGNVNKPGYLNGYDIGGLVGQLYQGSISRCSASVQTVGNGSVGGLVGLIIRGSVSNCSASGKTTGFKLTGGFIGYNFEGVISNSYSLGSVNRVNGTNTDIAGFVGSNLQGKIINCYSSGNVTYNSTINPRNKGFAGAVSTGGNYQMTGNFWDNQSSGQSSTSGIATGKNTTEMKKKTTFSSVKWNFTNTWKIIENTTYPYLQWQKFGEILTENVNKSYTNILYKNEYKAGPPFPGTSGIDWFLSSNSSVWLSIDSNGVLKGIPLSTDIGTYWVNVSTRVGGITIDYTNFTLEVIPLGNLQPSIKRTVNTSAFEDIYYQVDFTASDPNPLDTLTWNIASNASWLYLNQTKGGISGTPVNSNVGEYWVNATVSDNHGASDTFNFTLTVKNTNDDPIIESSPRLYATEEVPYSYDINASDDDLNISVGEHLTFSLDVGPVGMIINSLSGLLEWTPTNAQACQDYTVVARVTDLSGAYDLQTFVINVSNTNDPPTITSTEITAAVERQLYSYDVDATDDDLMNPSGEVLTFSLDLYPSNMTIDPATGLIQWTPSNAQACIEHTVAVNVTDHLGLYSTQIYSINVSNVNDPPHITSVPVTSAMQDEQYVYDVQASDDDTANPSDEVLTFTLASGPAGMGIDPTTGVVLWTPDKYQASREFTVQINVSDKAMAFAVQTFKISVSNVNDPPETNVSVSVLSLEEDTVDTSVRLDDWFTDVDGDPLTYRCTGTKEISVDILDDSTVSLSPKADWSGVEVLCFYANDSAYEAMHSVEVTVVPVNDPPNGAYITFENRPYYVGGAQPASGNATDPDIPYGDALTFTWSSNISGKIGTGQSVNLSLLAGTHLITLNVTDREGARCIVTSELTISDIPIPPTDDDDDVVDANDTDADGLPDVWEMSYFHDLTHAPAEDYDADGYTNIQEYLNTTDPTDPNSHPTVSLDDDNNDDDTVGFLKSNLMIVALISALLLILIIALIIIIVRRKKTQEKELPEVEENSSKEEDEEEGSDEPENLTEPEAEAEDMEETKEDTEISDALDEMEKDVREAEIQSEPEIETVPDENRPAIETTGGEKEEIKSESKKAEE